MQMDFDFYWPCLCHCPILQANVSLRDELCLTLARLDSVHVLKMSLDISAEFSGKCVFYKMNNLCLLYSKAQEVK